MSTTALALLGGLGSLLIVTAGQRRVLRSGGSRRALSLRLGLEQVQARRPLVDRLFGALAEDLLRRRNEADVETRIRQAGLWQRARAPRTAGAPRMAGALYPDTRTFYAYKLAGATLLAVVGLGFGVVLAHIGDLSPAVSLGVGLGTGVMGFFLPDLDLKGKVSRRDDQMIADMASALDRLANFLAAGYPLPYAIHQLAERPGGVFVAELRHVAAQYDVSGDLVGGIEALLEDNGHLPPLVPFASLVRAATRLGGGVGVSLRALAEELRAELIQRITARGYRNTVLMIVPAFFAIVATLLVLAAPGAVRAFYSLSTGGF
jgi:tight adherence protein C